MVILDLGSSILLIVSIQRFRKISNDNPGLEESKLAIFLHLTLFSIETLFIIGFVTFQFVYIKTEDSKYFTIASWLHVIAQCFTCTVNTYIAYLIY